MKRSRYHPPKEVVSGDTWTIDITCHNIDGSPLDISSATEIEWKFERIGGSEIIFTNTLGDGVAFFTDGKNGKIRVVVDETDTDDIGPGTYNDQLRIWLADAVSTLSRGRIDVISPLKPVQIMVALSLVSSRPEIGGPLAGTSGGQA